MSDKITNNQNDTIIPQLHPNPHVIKEKNDRTLLLIESREKQRAELLKSVLGFSLKIIMALYGFAAVVFILIFWKIPANNLVKLADFWHILLIVLLPPTSLLMMLIRGVSFSANSSEFKSSEKDDKDKGKESILDSIPTATTTVIKEGKEVIIKLADAISPSDKKGNNQS